jgi:hypothetical protein
MRCGHSRRVSHHRLHIQAALRYLWLSNPVLAFHPGIVADEESNDRELSPKILFQFVKKKR